MEPVTVPAAPQNVSFISAHGSASCRNSRGPGELVYVSATAVWFVPGVLGRTGDQAAIDRGEQHGAERGANRGEKENNRQAAAEHQPEDGEIRRHCRRQLAQEGPGRGESVLHSCTMALKQRGFQVKKVPKV
jgi:hypothetical protein